MDSNRFKIKKERELFSISRSYRFLSSSNATITSTIITIVAPTSEYIITSDAVAAVTGLDVGAVVVDDGALATIADVSA